ncbi:MAG: 4'-phosphopantetheinyl transferase superfamily protein [Clostridia bacterium]|nr:4'-phosphopantetheinyl transferase superfamily protein [Clostridia bacterium]
MKYAICCLEDISQEEYALTFSEMQEERKRKVERFMRNADKQRTIAGEYLVKKLLSTVEDKPLNEIVVASARNGKPKVLGMPFCISISHSENMVAAAVSDNPVGIDLEKIRPVSVSLVQRVCTAKELEYVLQNESYISKEQVENADVLKRFFEIWTAKEACFKCNGGNGKPFTEIETLASEIEKLTPELPGYSVCVVQMKTS